MSQDNLPYLSQRRCESLDIGIDDVIGIIEKLVVGTAEGRVWNAPKAVVMPGDGRYMMATLCVSDDPPLMAVKSLALNPKNSERGLNQINAVVALQDSETGEPLAIVDGNWVTAVRTAGLSAVAARRLARGDSKVVAFIGCGVQAHSHLEAFRQMFPVTEVRAMGRGTANRDRFCKFAESQGLHAVACDNARDTVGSADIIVTSVTLSYQTEPFIDARWLKEGAFASITDLGIPWLPEGMDAFDRIVIDDLEQERKMEKPLVATDLIDGDLTGLVSGSLAARQGNQERTAFVFRGLSLGDLALAALAWQRYRDLPEQDS